MKIESIEAREIAMRLQKPFETSFGVTQDRRILLLELRTDQGSGWGEVTASEGPFYNSETTDTAWLVLRTFIAPLLVGRSFAGPAEVLEAMAPSGGTRWPRQPLRPRPGMPRPGITNFRCTRCWGAHRKRSFAGSRSASIRMSRACSTRWPKRFRPDTRESN